MENIYFCMLVLVLILIIIVQEIITLRGEGFVSGIKRKKYVLLLLGSVFNIIWIVCAVVIGMSILVFLTGLYASFLVTMLPLYREKSAWIRFCQMKFVVLTASTLIFLGSMSLFGTDIQHMSQIREIRLLVLLGAKAVELIYIVVHKRFFAEDFKNLERDHKKIGLFQGFLFCCLIYIYADGVLAIFDFGEDFVPALMISGNMLILILMFIFYRFDYVMEQKEYLEKEHQQLIEEKAREIWKAEQLKSMAERDTLTNAYSRRYVVQNIERLKRDKIPFVIAYIDMDKMKEVNDTRGHLAGDIYLKNFVSSFTNKLRGDDYIARIGGDEFLVVMCRCSVEDGKKRMEEICMSLPEYPFSYGIASDENNVEAIIEEADRCMYNLKKQKTGGI